MKSGTSGSKRTVCKIGVRIIGVCKGRFGCNSLNKDYKGRQFLRLPKQFTGAHLCTSVY